MSETMDQTPTANYVGDVNRRPRPVTCGAASCLVAYTFAERQGLRTGLTRALKMSKSVPKGQKGMDVLRAYLKSQIKIAEEIPF